MVGDCHWQQQSGEAEAEEQRAAEHWGGEEVETVWTLWGKGCQEDRSRFLDEGILDV